MLLNRISQALQHILPSCFTGTPQDQLLLDQEQEIDTSQPSSFSPDDPKKEQYYTDRSFSRLWSCASLKVAFFLGASAVLHGGASIV